MLVQLGALVHACSCSHLVEHIEHFAEAVNSIAMQLVPVACIQVVDRVGGRCSRPW